MTEPGKFDPRHSGELLKHMDKQNEILMEAYRSMLHELQKLQVEEEMLMRKLYEVMSIRSSTKQPPLPLTSVERKGQGGKHCRMKTTPTHPIIVKELNSPLMKSIQIMRNSNDNSCWTQITYSIKRKEKHGSCHTLTLTIPDAVESA
ncbi:hypothetical protein L195_g021321 [Trifolium pratense]|uniref:Uncharacterized protein n=1 Tax=Trifolium pratense TaxID=57577 RepID=A0A2K3N4V2_TRIPR|nr:hypothetical protein L195_g021321 [Trifolium pratense]